MAASRLLVIAYDTPVLRGTPKELPDVIKDNARAWWHHLKTVWIVESDHDADWWAERLQPHIEPESLIVLEISLHAAEGLLPARGWAWLAKRIDR